MMSTANRNRAGGDPERKARRLFVAVLSIGLAAGLAWYLLSSARYATYELRTRDPVSGLIVDAPVEFHGVEVGKVTRVELADAHSVRVLVDIKHGTPVSSATVATITSRGLATRGFTGYVYVSLDNDGVDEKPLVTEGGASHPVIRTSPSRIVSLDVAIAHMDENVQALSALVQTLLDAKTVDSLKHAARRVGPLLENSNDTVKALQNQVLPETHRTLTELDQLSSKLTGAATKIERDPSVVLRGAKPPKPGPGERK
jgi:phospholipid/cholesterol/gamma-HCH transport system substrate-binding protein